ncbi:hypothetical protein N9W61_01320, partial [Algibacter sp.]|nr:hypothetical protein [Algibacter sp.]
MKILKQMFHYLIWIVVAMLIGMGFMRLVLGAKKRLLESWFGRLDFAYDLILVYVGLSIGAVIALIFILTDIFYLKKKLSKDLKSTTIRLL